MAVFRFRMQNILEMKEKLEEQAKNEFAHAQRALAEEEELLNALFQKKEAYIEQGIQLRNRVIDIQEIMDNKKAIEHTDMLIEQQKLSVAVAGKKVDAATKQLMDARDRKSVV